MSQQHLYLALQRLDQSAGFDQYWLDLIAALEAKGANQNPNPSHRNHWRFSLDGLIGIYEAEYNSTNIDVDWFINWLAGQFGVPAGEIGESTGYNTYGRFSTFSYQAGVTNRFRIGVFGFVSGQGWPSYQESHVAVLQYLIDNLPAWEAPDI